MCKIFCPTLYSDLKFSFSSSILNGVGGWGWGGGGGGGRQWQFKFLSKGHLLGNLYWQNLWGLNHLHGLPLHTLRPVATYMAVPKVGVVVITMQYGNNTSKLHIQQIVTRVCDFLLFPMSNITASKFSLVSLKLVRILKYRLPLLDPKCYLLVGFSAWFIWLKTFCCTCIVSGSTEIIIARVTRLRKFNGIV